MSLLLGFFISHASNNSVMSHGASEFLFFAGCELEMCDMQNFSYHDVKPFLLQYNIYHNTCS